MTDDPLTIDQLERWEAFGAHWRVVQITNNSAIVDLCACTGELIERGRSTDPDIIEYLRNRPTDQS